MALARWIQEHFGLVQGALAAILIGGAWFFFRPKTPESGFRVREADRLANAPKPPRGPDLASARIERKNPLQLPGIRLDGPPHEVLGVAPSAGRDEIQRAYRDLMKRYHPDKIGRPGSREWQDAQRIAEAINLAKEELLARLR